MKTLTVTSVHTGEDGASAVALTRSSRRQMRNFNAPGVCVVNQPFRTASDFQLLIFSTIYPPKGGVQRFMHSVCA